MSAKVLFRNDARRWRDHPTTNRLPLAIQAHQAGKRERAFLRLAAVWGVFILLKHIGNEVVTAVRSSQERRQRIADERDLERLIAFNPNFARDLGISSGRRFYGLS